MAYTHYTPLSTPTRLAAGLGLKEIPYPNGIRPCFGSPASQTWIKLMVIFYIIFIYVYFTTNNTWSSISRRKAGVDCLVSLIM